jgi:hypothetical protein
MCPLGYVCANASMAAPTACSAGKFCGTTGLSVSSACGIGSYCAVTALSASTACIPGYVKFALCACLFYFAHKVESDIYILNLLSELEYFFDSFFILYYSTAFSVPLSA